MLGTRLLWLAAAVLGFAAATACAPKTARRQTDIMEGTGKVGVSAAVLRARVNDLVDRSAGRLEETADRIIARTPDAGVRRRARLLQADAVPAVYTAGFRADPLAAAVDVWVFALQFKEYMENGAGRNAFGQEQHLAAACAADLIADTDATLRAIAIGQEHFDVARARVVRWAAAHPVEHAFSARASGVTLVADLQSENRDIFVTVGDVADVIENLSERLNTYAAQLPKQARWQAEILLAEMTGSGSLEAALDDLHDMGSAVGRATKLLEDLPRMLEAQQNILATERRAVLAGVNSQRELTLEHMTAERVAVVAAARAEREVILAALGQERVAALAEVDAIRTRAVESGLAGVRDLIDYTLWRVAVLLCCLMLVSVVLGVIGYRLTLGRQPVAAAS
jgi:hypothetical protein